MSTTTLNRPAQEPTTPPAATAWVPTTADRCDACGAQAYVRVVLAAGVLSPAQQTELIARRDSLNPAELARRIHDEQQILIKLAKDKTDELRHTIQAKTQPPDTNRGIRLPRPS